jgi:hypothetical protein
VAAEVRRTGWISAEIHRNFILPLVSFSLKAEARLYFSLG